MDATHARKILADAVTTHGGRKILESLGFGSIINQPLAGDDASTVTVAEAYAMAVAKANAEIEAREYADFIRRSRTEAAEEYRGLCAELARLRNDRYESDSAEKLAATERRIEWTRREAAEAKSRM